MNLPLQESMTTSNWRQHNAKFWSQLAQFYVNENIAAWNNKVPHLITNNPMHAQRYAQIITQYILDCHRADQNTKFAIFEVGAGLGKFGFLFVKHLIDLLDQCPNLSSKIQYILCDQAKATQTFWQQHPQIKPLIAKNIIHTALLSINSNLQISCNFPLTHLKQHRMILLANYCFDSLPQSPFIINKARCIPCRIQTSARLTTQQPEKLSFNPVYKPTSEHSSCPTYNAIVDAHIPLGAEHFLMPDGALTLIQWFDQQTIHPLLILASDKGFSGFQKKQYDKDFNIVHSGAFASCVNFYAISRFIEIALHGSSSLAPETEFGFATNLFLTKQAYQAYPGLTITIRSTLRNIESGIQFAIYKLLRTTPITKIEQIFYILNTLQYDPNILISLLPNIKTCLNQDQSFSELDIDRILKKIFANYFFTPHNSSLVELIAIIELALLSKRYIFARLLLNDFALWHGENYEYHYFSGKFFFVQSEFISAAHYFTNALAINPDCKSSQTYLEHCDTFL